MSKEITVENAIIRSVSIGYDRDIFLTVWVSLDFEVGTQGFGGFVLGADPQSGAEAVSGNDLGYLAYWVNGILKATGVDSIEKAQGKAVRVKRVNGRSGEILAIGHITKNFWFNPKEDCAHLGEKE